LLEARRRPLDRCPSPQRRMTIERIEGVPEESVFSGRARIPIVSYIT
jgi:hypothetical protein